MEQEVSGALQLDEHSPGDALREDSSVSHRHDQIVCAMDDQSGRGDLRQSPPCVVLPRRRALRLEHSCRNRTARAVTNLLLDEVGVCGCKCVVVQDLTGDPIGLLGAASPTSQ